MQDKNIPARKPNDSDKEQTTVADLLNRYKLPAAIRIYLEDFAAGHHVHAFEKSEDVGIYELGEYLADVLDDKHRTAGQDVDLPPAALEFVETFLYRLAETSGIHVWNNSDALRACLPTMYDCAEGNMFGESTEQSAIVAALQALCTKRELAAFHERAGYVDPILETDIGIASEQAQERYNMAIQTASIIADPRTPARLREKLEGVICELSQSTQVTLWHPALVERALVVMFEAMSTPATGDNAELYERDRQRDYTALHELLAEAEEGRAT